MNSVDKKHALLGEAAMNLILRQEDVTVVMLIRELHAIADNEKDYDLLMAIHAARSWLNDFRRPGSLSRSRHSGLRLPT